MYGVSWWGLLSNEQIFITKALFGIIIKLFVFYSVPNDSVYILFVLKQYEDRLQIDYKIFTQIIAKSKIYCHIPQYKFY